MGPESLHYSKWRKSLNSCRDLGPTMPSKCRKSLKSCHDLGPTMPNIELVPVIFIYYNVFNFHVPRSISFLVIVQKHTHTETQTHTHAHSHTHQHTYTQTHTHTHTHGRTQRL